MCGRWLPEGSRVREQAGRERQSGRQRWWLGRLPRCARRAAGGMSTRGAARFLVPWHPLQATACRNRTSIGGARSNLDQITLISSADTAAKAQQEPQLPCKSSDARGAAAAGVTAGAAATRPGRTGQLPLPPRASLAPWAASARQPQREPTTPQLRRTWSRTAGTLPCARQSNAKGTPAWASRRPGLWRAAARPGGGPAAGGGAWRVRVRRGKQGCCPTSAGSSMATQPVPGNCCTPRAIARGLRLVAYGKAA